MNILNRFKYAFTRKAAWVFVPLFIIAGVVPSTSVQAESFPDAGFEDNTFTGWSRGSQTGNLGASINGNGTGVTIFNGSRTFTHGANGAMGSPTLSDGSPNPYYASAVAAGSWTFSPNGGTYAVALQPKNEQTFDQATNAVGLSGTDNSAIKTMLAQQAAAAGFGGGNPTDAAWITREVELTAGVTYTMSWNYMATDYVPFNDGSITSLVPVTVASTPVITVNNFEQSYALLGFTNPGTGDYSTNSYGSTGWQTSTYEVSVSGTYNLGFTVFNLDDTALSPVLMVDNETGETERCIQGGSCETFGGVEPNNETAPTLPPTTTTEATTTTTTTSTTSTTTTTTTVLPAPISLQVTSLGDDGSDGTLRWAINQANANSGGIYDAIDITTEGTITLTSDLPSITEGVTITGTGMATTIIDGDNLYRSLNNNGTRTIAVSDMTFKRGKATNGGIGYTNNGGTFTFIRVKFTDMASGSAWFQSNANVTTFTDSEFSALSIGIQSDYGSTPSALSQTDSDYTNRIYIDGSTFTNNTYGIRTERFVKINNSQFTDNTYGAVLRGLNRQQVLNSVFTSNFVGVNFASWIPTTWTPGAGNQTVSGSTFNGNTTAIQFANNFNNGSTTYNGVSANSWSTSIGNSFGATAVNTANYSGSGYVTEGDTITTTTTTTSTTTTTTTIPVPANTNPVYTEPINTNPVYTEPINTEPVYTEPIDTDPVYTEPIDTDPVYTEPIDTDPVYTEPIDTEPVYTEPIDTDPIETTDFTDEEIINIIDSIDTTSSEEVAAVLDDIFTSDISTEQLTEVLDAVFTADVEAEVLVAALDAVLSADISTEEFAAVLDAVFDEPLSDEQFTAVIDSVITEDITDEQFAEVLNALESDTVSEEQVAEAVDAVLENDVTEDQATDLASSSKVLESIDTTQAEAVFEAIPVGDLTQAEEAALVAAVTDAPQEIKETFEETIDIYGEGLDDYVAVGSQVDVGSRRTLIAATTAVAAVAGAAATGGASGGSTGGSGGSSGGGSGSSSAEGRSKREEEGQEPAGEIAGLDDEDDEEYTRNSIFNYYLEEGTWKTKISWFGLVKKFVNETAALSFTLAGSVVVFITLSGDTRKTAMIATGVALAVHYIHVLLKNDEA